LRQIALYGVAMRPTVLTLANLGRATRDARGQGGSAPDLGTKTFYVFG